VDTIQVRSEVFMAVTMRNGVFWDVALVRTTRHNIPEDTILNIQVVQILDCLGQRKFTAYVAEVKDEKGRMIHL
jgi:hypothetical protein